jgi:hypothetical protein
MDQKSVQKVKSPSWLKKKLPPKLGSILFRIRVIGGIFVVFWVGFLFLESKYGISKHLTNSVNSVLSTNLSGEQET